MKIKKRLILYVTTIVTLLSIVIVSVFATQSKTENFNKSFSLTGKGAADIVAVAKAQVDRTKSQFGYAEAENWCADFVCDCAKLANIKDTIIPHNYASRGICLYLYNYMLNNCDARKVSSPQAGDFVFYYCSTSKTYCHVGIMIDSTYYVSGNMWTSGTSKVEKQKAVGGYYDGHGSGAGCTSPVYVRPNYSATTTYTITYNANGGTGAPATGKKTQGVNYTVPSTVPTRTGYKFVGWAKGGPTDTTVYVKPGGTIYWDGDFKLYAIWESNKLKVSYNANGGKISSDTYYVGSGNDVYKVSNSSKFVVTYPKNTSGSYSSITDPLGQYGLYDCATFGISKEGYKFAGWSKTKDGSGTIYSQTDATLRPVDISSDVKTKDVSVTLYAIWVSNKINISYNANSGTITSDTYYDGSNGDVYKKSTSAKAVYTYPKNATGSNSTINDPLSDTGLMNAKTIGLSKTNYDFVGWSTTKDGSDKIFDQDDTALRPIDISSAVKTKDVSVTMYAVWKVSSTFTGLMEADDGNWYYYRNGEIDYSENGIVKNEYGYWKCTNGIVDFSYTGLAWSSDLGQYLYCVDGKVDFEYDVPNLSNLKIRSASVSLGNSLSMQYKVAKSALEGFENPYITVYRNDKIIYLTEYTESGSDYVFRLSNIAPQTMNDKTVALLKASYKGVEYASEKEIDFSVADYTYSMLERATGDSYAKLRTLLVDLLNYGAAAQQYQNYKTDELVNAKLTDEQKAMGSSEPLVLENISDKNYVEVENASVTWKSAALVLNDAISVKYKFTTTEMISDLSFVVELAGKSYTYDSSYVTDEGNGVYSIRFDNIMAHNMRDNITITAYKDGNAVSNTMLYSVESYASLIEDNTPGTALDNLTHAMMRYGISAKAYISK